MSEHGFKEYLILELISIPSWIPQSIYSTWEPMIGRFSVFSAKHVMEPDFQRDYKYCFKIHARFFVPSYHRVSAMNTNYWGAFHTLDGALEYVIKRSWRYEVMDDD